MLLIEKNNSINICENFLINNLQDIKTIKLNNKHLINKHLTLNSILKTTQQRVGNELFFNWNLYKNNCQEFTKEILKTIGNYNINISDIDKCLQNNIILNKVIYYYESEKIQNIKNINPNKTIIFTNGCFDILHSAHIKILQFSKKQGDILVVGINSNEPIKRLKGPERPINDIEERTNILSLFDFIDYIIIFNDDTPYNIIELLNPNMLVKGSEYKKEDIIGANLVNDVILFDYIQNKSTSLIVNKIKGK